jgi:hypothetical protein
MHSHLLALAAAPHTPSQPAQRGFQVAIAVASSAIRTGLELGTERTACSRLRSGPSRVCAYNDHSLGRRGLTIPTDGRTSVIGSLRSQGNRYRGTLGIVVSFLFKFALTIL